MKLILGFRNVENEYHENTAEFYRVDSVVMENTKRVIHSAASIERHLENFIRFHFYPKNSPQSVLFEDSILHSDFFTAHVKKRVYLDILKQLKVNAQKIRDLEKLLPKINRYRNAFTHGRIRYDKDLNATLLYFEGGKQERLIDDEYLDNIEKDLHACIKLLFGISREFNAPTENDIAGLFSLNESEAG